MADKLRTFNTISEYHVFRGLAAPEHPLISVSYCGANYENITPSTHGFQLLSCNFYMIILKKNPQDKLKYGQQLYDFNEGVLLFIAPKQIVGIPSVLTEKLDGWVLMVHPDFLLNTPLMDSIRHYDYFDYATNEALFLSKKEEASFETIFQNIVQEYQNNIDTYSKNIVIAHLQLLLSYSERYYNRQFITRDITNRAVLSSLEQLLQQSFEEKHLQLHGVPTVLDIAHQLHLSPNYLSSLLKATTGMSTQQHIQHKIIEKAKEKLSTTELTISEIAFGLGFEYPQSFSKLFKKKTQLSPQAFREKFN